MFANVFSKMKCDLVTVCLAVLVFIWLVLQVTRRTGSHLRDKLSIQEEFSFIVVKKLAGIVAQPFRTLSSLHHSLADIVDKFRLLLLL